MFINTQRISVDRTVKRLCNAGCSRKKLCVQQPYKRWKPG